MSEAFYTELHEELRGLCDPELGEFGPGDRFLTERQVAERFGTTRPTANKALASLVGQGVLEFRRGVGTFVCDAPPLLDIRATASLSAMATAVGSVVTNKVFTFRRTRGSRVDEAVRKALRIGKKEPLLAIERMRYVDDEPFSYEQIHVVSRYCEDLSRADAKGSLVAVWEDYYKLRIDGIDQVVSAVNAEQDIAHALNTKRGAAVFCIVNTGFLNDGRRLWHGESLVRGDSYQLVGRLGGPAVGRPMSGRLLADPTESE